MMNFSSIYLVLDTDSLISMSKAKGKFIVSEQKSNDHFKSDAAINYHFFQSDAIPRIIF